jgi:hypothetical protein
MDSSKQSRRPAFVYPVRAHNQAGALDVVLSKVASLAILATLLVVAWVAFSFLRTSLAGSPGETPPIPTTKAVAPAVPNHLAKREPIVYVAETDTNFYHQCGHMPEGCPRQAVPASVARTRGFAPCPDCFPK